MRSLNRSYSGKVFRWEKVIMASTSPSRERSPSPTYASSTKLTPGRTPSHEYTPAATDHYVYRYRWVALCGRLRGKPVSQLRDMEYEIF
ncbi:hypothetical protein LIER_01872 [Lithospermum erythrorhizon]|uniref:Uncharacterized protein n=1 Tax=Lithospermum erythrorhizon TaxID=34254 RepID=A0AAV3NN83_LITER